MPDLEDIEITGLDDHPPDSSVRLWGPPGCGKTTQSAARVATLLDSDDYDYDLGDVVWATYRKSLAVDTLTRLADWNVIDRSQLDDPAKGETRYIATMHAIGNRTIDNLPTPADRRDRIDFCDKRGIRYTSNLPWKDGVGELLFQGFSWLKANRLDPSDPVDVRRWPNYTDLSERWNGDMTEVWRDWVDYKAARERIDYYEMLERPLKDGVAPPGDVLVIDEYHDVTPLMAELAEMWAEAFETVIVAGDPNQVVNAYDGADPGFFERLDYPKVLLDRSYRVPEEHWRLATTMLSFAHEVPPVERVGRGYIDEYQSPEFRFDEGHEGWQVPTPDTTAGPVWLHDRYDGHTLFLTRTQMQAAGVARALDEGGVIYASQNEIDGWNGDSPRLLLHNALQTIQKVSPGDFQGAGGIAQYSTSGLDPKDVSLSVSAAATLLAHTNAQYLAQSRTETEEHCRELEGQAVRVTLAELDELVEDEFWQVHTAGASSVGRLNQGDLDDNGKAALQAALKRYDEPVSPGGQPAEVLTIHASKGKGAENVVVYDGTSKRAAEAMHDSDRSKANEYRTWYVALTRASTRLCVMRDAFDWMIPIIPNELAAVVESGGGAHDVQHDATDATDV